MEKTKRKWALVGVVALPVIVAVALWSIPGVRYTALDSAINGRHRALAELLVFAGSDPNGRDYSINVTPWEPNHPVMSAIRSGDTVLLRFLFAHGADVNFQWGMGISPLGFAVELGQPEIVKVLVESGADPDLENFGFASEPRDESTPRKLAEKMKNPEVLIIIRTVPSHTAKSFSPRPGGPM